MFTQPLHFHVLTSHKQSFSRENPPSLSATMSTNQKPVVGQIDGSTTCDLLTCAICTEPYDDDEHLPKLLSCHHSFCQVCLTTLSSIGQKRALPCPTCRENTSLPSGGVSKLQTNFYVAQVREFVELRSAEDQGECGCLKHQRKCDLFCVACDRSICGECRVEDHAGHVTNPVDEALVVQQKLMQSEIAASWPLVLASGRLRVTAEAQARFLLALKRQAEEELNAAFGQLQEMLRLQKNRLQEELDEAYDDRCKVVHSRLDDATKISKTLRGIVETCQRALTSTSSVDNLVAHRSKLAAKIQELQTNDKIRTAQVSGVAFNKGNLQDLNCVDLGSIATDKPLLSSVLVKDCQAVACQISTVGFVVTDFDGAEVNCDYPLDVEVTDFYNDVLQSNLERTTSGQYMATFRPQVSGLHHVTVRIWHHVLATCPVTVESNDPVSSYGTQSDDAMQYPRDVAVDSAGNIYVADSGNGRILKYDDGGTLLLEFPISDDAADDYSTCGIAIDHHRNTVVCTEILFIGADPAETRSIAKYSSCGKRLGQSSLLNILKHGLSLAINSLGHTIIPDTNQDAIFVFDTQGRFLKKFGETGSGPGQFKRPTFICVDKDDSIIVSDGENGRVQIFDKTGRFVRSLGEKGSGKGQFTLPFGVAADRFGNILVVDGGNRRIQVFGRGGQFVGCVESLGDGMNAPRGIDVTADGHLLVADRDNHCVKKYRYL